MVCKNINYLIIQKLFKKIIFVFLKDLKGFTKIWMFFYTIYTIGTQKIGGIFRGEKQQIRIKYGCLKLYFNKRVSIREFPITNGLQNVFQPFRIWQMPAKMKF